MMIQSSAFSFLRSWTAGLLLVMAAGSAAAQDVRVQINGVVDFNVIQGGLAGVQSGAPVTLSFSVDANDYLNSSNFPTRGYRINLASFDLNVGGVHMTLDNPQGDGGPVYFVLRDNDPAVDGFFISRGVELPFPADLHVPGLTPTHEFEFSRSFTVGTALSSLNILDAVGNYGFENMGSYLWTIGRFGNAGIEFAYQSMTIGVVPEPASAALFALGGAALLLRARRRTN